MNKIDYFRLQAKNLFRAFETQQFDSEGLTFYSPKFFDDIEDIILSYNIDENNFTLMKAQHIIALLAGFHKWSDLIHANDAALELGKLLIDNRNSRLPFNGFLPLLTEWEMYVYMNRHIFDNISDESKLEIFKTIVLKEN